MDSESVFEIRTDAIAHIKLDSKTAFESICQIRVTQEIENSSKQWVAPNEISQTIKNVIQKETSLHILCGEDKHIGFFQVIQIGCVGHWAGSYML